MRRTEHLRPFFTSTYLHVYDVHSIDSYSSMDDGKVTADRALGLMPKGEYTITVGPKPLSKAVKAAFVENQVIGTVRYTIISQRRPNPKSCCTSRNEGRHLETEVCQLHTSCR